MKDQAGGAQNFIAFEGDHRKRDSIAIAKTLETGPPFLDRVAFTELAPLRMLPFRKSRERTRMVGEIFDFHGATIQWEPRVLVCQPEGVIPCRACSSRPLGGDQKVRP